MDSRFGAGVAKLYADRVNGGVFASTDQVLACFEYQSLIDAASCHNPPLCIFRTVVRIMYMHTILY